MFGNYENLISELERESHWDFMGYLKMQPAMFYESPAEIDPKTDQVRHQVAEILEPRTEAGRQPGNG